MYDVINQFRKDKAEGLVFGDHLEELYSRLREAAYLEKHKPQLGRPQPGESVVQQDLQFKKPAPKLSLTQTKLIPTIKKRLNPSPAKVKDTDNQSPKEKLLPTDQSFLFDPVSTSRGTKRLSDQDSCCPSNPSNPSLTSSHQTNAASIYPGQANQSFATTVDTSFDGIYDDCDSSSIDYGGDWDPSQAEQLDQLMTGFEPPEYAPKNSGVVGQSLDPCQHLNGRSLDNPSMTPADTPTTAAKIQVQLQDSLAAKVPTPKSKSASSKVPEHRLVRSLPSGGLFSSPMAISVNHPSFYHLWESYRLADAAGTPFNYYANEDELYTNIPAGVQSQRTPASVWKDRTDPTQAANIMLKANLVFDVSPSADELLTLSLQPLKTERACILQRRFGSSRFLYVEVPQIHTFNGIHLKEQQDLLKLRYKEWLCTEKEFLGRVWRVFHVQDVKKKNSKDNLPSQRLVLFAVDGPRLQKISLSKMLNWAIPFAKNGDQGFCKAYARLDLFLSQTIPTVKFTHGEVKYVKDTLANGASENEEFSDPDMKFEYRSGSSNEK
ncbi:hypothetical protein KCU73_g8968, partial [Aureobasidium melanogenum]